MDKESEVIRVMKERRAHYISCFSGESGEFVLKDIAKVAYANYPTFSSDPYETAYKEGMRSLYLYIMRSMKMIKENKKEG